MSSEEAPRARAAERLGLTPEVLMVHAIQSHSAPSCGQFMLDPDFAMDHRRIGRELAETAGKVVSGLSFRGDAAVDWRIRRVLLPYREVAARPGHETHPLCTYRSKLAPESLDIIVRNATELLKEMFS